MENSHDINDFHLEDTPEMFNTATKPNTMISNAFLASRRAKRDFVPDAQKDVCYWMKRLKNNDSARRSRIKRRFADKLMERKLTALENENFTLRYELEILRQNLIFYQQHTFSEHDSHHKNNIADALSTKFCDNLLSAEMTGFASVKMNPSFVDSDVSSCGMSGGSSQNSSDAEVENKVIFSEDMEDAISSYPTKSGELVSSVHSSWSHDLNKVPHKLRRKLYMLNASHREAPGTKLHPAVA